VAGPPAFDAIAFDMDGVLVDTEACHRRAFEALWRHVGVEGPTYATIAGRPTTSVVREVTGVLGPAEPLLLEWVAMKQRLARECIARDDIAFEDTPLTIPRLGRLYRMAIVTGGSEQTVVGTLDRYDLARWFETVVTAADVESGKPSPDGYLRAMERLGADPQHTLVVEDSSNGLKAGLASGARVVSVRSGLVEEHPGFLGAFSSLGELIDGLGLLA
jgi:HAD superfamily hydrolase (TIGR01509 family)